MSAKQPTEPKICIWCTVNEIEHGFDIPLCTACLVKIHFMTTDRKFDANKEVQQYLKDKIKKPEESKIAPGQTSLT